MQKISSIHEPIFTLQQILEFHELNGHAHFDHGHPKIIEITFSFLKFAPVFKKSVHYVYSFLNPMTRLATLIFEYAHSKIFWSTFSL